MQFVKIPDSWTLFIFQIMAHTAFVFQLFYGSWYHWVLSIAVYFLTGCFGMTMTYHRLLSHKSWNAPSWYEKFGTLCGTYGLVGSSIGWVAVHREHHHHTDDEKDPHSPKHKGFVSVQWLSMFEKINPKYALHLIKDPFHMFLHKYYFFIHTGIFVVLGLISPMLLVSVYLVPAAMLWNAGSFINTLTHMMGYRNYDTKDCSTNIWWLGYFMWGEGWHNNHHNQPNNSTFGEKWWEYDIGSKFIKLLEVKTKP
jgi:stearoyl-CoA desaturase (delta-9 desaturase)